MKNKSNKLAKLERKRFSVFTSNDKCFINKQYLKFLKYKNYVNNADVIFHISNSYAITYNQRLNLNMVRSGFLLYGYTENKFNNKPVLSITSKIIRVLIDRQNKHNKFVKIMICLIFIS